MSPSSASAPAEPLSPKTPAASSATAAATTASDAHAHASAATAAALCSQVLRAVATLCDTDRATGSTSDSRNSSGSSSTGRDSARDALWRVQGLCEDILRAMWSWGPTDPHVLEYGFKAVSALVHRDETGERRRAFGLAVVTCPRALYAREVGLCDVFLFCGQRWLEHACPPHCVEEGVKALHHLTVKGQQATLERFTHFFDGAAADELTEVVVLKVQLRAALRIKLLADVEDAVKRNKKAKARALQSNFPAFLLPK